MNTTLPTESQARKDIPIVSGCLNYFPAALADVARISKAGNDRHNPGEPLHHARGKSTDHADCIVRHLIDLQGLLAAYERYHEAVRVQADRTDILAEASALAWRALALSQELHERFGAPLAPGARLPFSEPTVANAAAALDRLPIAVAVPFRVEAGKRYVRRDGMLSGTLVSSGYSAFPLTDGQTSYMLSGRFLGVSESQCDLVREYVDVTPEQAVARQE